MNLTPRGITAISPGLASTTPNSVRSSSRPSCGTSSNSPSASQKTRHSIDRVAR